MKRKEKKKSETMAYENMDNLELDLKMMETELYSWLINNSYRNYGKEKKQKITNKSKKIIFINHKNKGK